MPEACTITDNMSGSVGHHAGHVIGYTSEGAPIYCSGHGVGGTQATGSNKVVIQGQRAARLYDTGTTNCPCDGADYTNVSASNKVIIEGLGAVRLGDSVDIHGAGSGNMITGKAKVIMA